MLTKGGRILNYSLSFETYGLESGLKSIFIKYKHKERTKTMCLRASEEREEKGCIYSLLSLHALLASA